MPLANIDSVPAGTPERTSLPLFYNQILPLSPNQHRELAVDRHRDFAFAKDTTALPLVCEEIPVTQRDYPVVFTNDEYPMPVALVGLEGKGNRLIDNEGSWYPNRYIPAYVRRYPFLLVRETTNGSKYCLCVDPSADAVETKDVHGNLFDGDEPSTYTKQQLQFCLDFEKGLQRTRAFGERLAAFDLLEDGAVQIDRGGKRTELNGFQVVSEAKLSTLDDATKVQLVESKDLALIYAHLFSLARFSSLIVPDA